MIMVAGSVVQNRLVRLVTGLFQGALLYALYIARADPQVWPATDAMVFTPAVLVACYVPLAVLLGVGSMRAHTLTAWAAAATTVLVLLALHGTDRHVGALHQQSEAEYQVRLLPMLVLWCAPLLFITQSLVAAADIDRRLIAHYKTYFELAWKMAVQLVFAAGFLAMIWGVLFLGAALFELIGLEFLNRLIDESWFAIPVSTLSIAFAIHLSDVREGITRAIRTLVLLLLSWLLPLLAIMLLGFLASLPFTGLERLWMTKSAAILLLSAAGLLVMMVNAVHQDGSVEHAPATVLRYAARLGAMLILPLTALAIYALVLRVGQYGWSTDRVIAASMLMIASVYGLGYAWAASGDRWSKSVESTNIAAAILTATILIALLSPVADPTRIGVADQVARLRDGRTAPEHFDYVHLRRDGKAYGAAALRSLAEDAELSAQIRSRAEETLRFKKPETDASVLLANLVIYPEGRTLPTGFAERWVAASKELDNPECFRQNIRRCDAHLIDLDGDGIDDILVVPASYSYERAVAFKGGPGSTWPLLGTISAHAMKCTGLRDGMRSGKAVTVNRMLNDLEIGGLRVPLEAAPMSANCP